MPQFQGTGGVVWEIDVPPEGSNLRELHDQRVAAGDLIPVDLPAPRKRAPKAAETADDIEEG